MPEYDGHNWFRTVPKVVIPADRITSISTMDGQVHLSLTPMSNKEVADIFAAMSKR